MEVRQLRCFVAVAEELHFGRAAQRLHVAQPAVSQQVSRLERELGVRLLERSSRRVALTGAGERLLGETRAALAAVERVRTVAGDLAAGRTATLRVGAGPGAGKRLGRAVSRLRTGAPDVAFVLVDGSASEHLTAVRAGELDIALVRGPVSTGDLQAVEVWREPLQVLLPATHPAAAPAAVSIEALGELTLRLPDRSADPALYDAVLAACRAGGVAPRTGRPARSLETVAVEIGVSESEATVLVGCGRDVPPPFGVAVRQIEPAVEVPGYLLMPPGTPPACLAALVAALA